MIYGGQLLGENEVFIVGGTMSGAGQVACFLERNEKEAKEIKERTCVIVTEDSGKFTFKIQTARCCMNSAVLFIKVGPNRELERFILDNQAEFIRQLRLPN